MENPVILFINIIKRGRQCKAGRQLYTPYQSIDPCPTIPTYRQKEEKGKIVEDKNGQRMGSWFKKFFTRQQG